MWTCGRLLPIRSIMQARLSQHQLCKPTPSNMWRYEDGLRIRM